MSMQVSWNCDVPTRQPTGGIFELSDGRIMGKSSETDRRFAGLMRRVQAGDQHAYAQLLNELAPVLRRTIRRQRAFLKSPDTEDLVQDLLLSLHEVRATDQADRP